MESTNTEECPVCLQSMNSFVSLQHCGHMVCTNCELLLRKYKRNDSVYGVRCPLCRNESFVFPREDSIISGLSIDQVERNKRKLLTSFEVLSIPFVALLPILQERIQQKVRIRFATNYEVEREPLLFTRESHKETDSLIHVDLMNRFVRLSDQKYISYYEASYIPDSILHSLIKERKGKKCEAYLCGMEDNAFLERNSFCQGYLHNHDRNITRRFCPNHENIRCCHHCFFCTKCVPVLQV